jgi:DNA-directed RNA polymerase subunit beta
MSATEEMRYTVAQANADLDENGRFTSDLVSTRKSGDFMLNPPANVDLIDVSPKQLVSVAASLIPFLENDDANRALMGSNMQRQAVPLLRAEAPFVGTGIEEIVARDSGAAIAARGRRGRPSGRDPYRRARHGGDGSDPSRRRHYRLRSSSVEPEHLHHAEAADPVGDVVAKGDIIADGPSTELGELGARPQRLVAFMPWNGYNFEDSILLSERIVKDDVFTSIHIEEFEVMARDTKLGPEEITRDIPNVSKRR